MYAIRNKTPKFISMLLISLFLIPGIISNLSGQEKSKKLYTAYNIWYKTPDWVEIINYKIFGDAITKFLPAGTEVKNLKLEFDSDDDSESFAFKAEGKSFGLTLNPRWHPGQNLKSYKKKMFTNKTFEELTAGMTEKTIDGIKRGTPVAGMTKKEVLIAFGYPPEHRTKSLKLNYWRYWISKSHRLVICFDKNEIAIRCSKPDDLWKRWQ